MTVDEAKAVIEMARGDRAPSQRVYIDIDDPEFALLDGRFRLEVLEAIVVVMKARVPVPVRAPEAAWPRSWLASRRYPRPAAAVLDRDETSASGGALPDETNERP